MVPQECAALTGAGGDAMIAIVLFNAHRPPGPCQHAKEAEHEASRQ
jgi:hypothetical protein